MIGLKVSIERNTNVPLFKQLTEQLRAAILRRDIPEGTRLPSEREMARLLKLNRSVVIKAYNELKLDALLDSK
ncbi:MAG TPA: winged helix-turn-helix domain-containing protein, partial [Mesotoga infera]|nr:winged helix-turn-helix domain-containing protein [Mesotoga infera]